MAMFSQIRRDTNFFTHQKWRGRSIKNSKAQCFSLPEIDLILISTYHKAVLWRSWYAIFVYSVWQLTFSRSDAKSSSLPPGGICDSGRYALKYTPRGFIVWWWSIWEWLMIRLCLAVVAEGRVLMRPCRDWLPWLFEGRLLTDKICVCPALEIRLMPVWLSGCHGDVPVFSMTLFVLINQAVLNPNVQWQLHVLLYVYIRINDSWLLISDFGFGALSLYCCQMIYQLYISYTSVSLMVVVISLPLAQKYLKCWSSG